jgi:hypothetical protein
MARGRPASGPQLVERLEGTETAKQRLQVLLETVAGQRQIADACDELGIGKTAFRARGGCGCRWPTSSPSRGVARSARSRSLR